MEPKQTSPDMAPRMPGQPQFEQSQTGVPGYEATPGAGQGYETLPANPERGYESAPAGQEIAPPPPLTPVPAIPVPPNSAPAIAAAPPAKPDDTPSIANDDDLIEKEWVEKAKRIISETKEDPFKRESEIKKLQLDYIRKRYGREIGDSGD